MMLVAAILAVPVVITAALAPVICWADRVRRWGR